MLAGWAGVCYIRLICHKPASQITRLSRLTVRHRQAWKAHHLVRASCCAQSGSCLSCSLSAGPGLQFLRAPAAQKAQLCAERSIEKQHQGSQLARFLLLVSGSPQWAQATLLFSCSLIESAVWSALSSPCVAGCNGHCAGAMSCRKQRCWLTLSPVGAASLSAGGCAASSSCLRASLHSTPLSVNTCRSCTIQVQHGLRQGALQHG